MFSLKFTLMLTVALIISLILRINEIEFFPAVFLPSGATTLDKIDDKVYLINKTVQAKNKLGYWQELNPDLLTNPMPKTTFAPLARINFGFINEEDLLRRRRYKLLRKLKLNHHIGLDKIKSDDTRDLVIWLKKKIAEQGLIASEFKISIYKLTISTTTGSILNKTLTNEKTILLDDFSK